MSWGLDACLYRGQANMNLSLTPQACCSLNDYLQFLLGRVQEHMLILLHSLPVASINVTET